VAGYLSVGHLIMAGRLDEAESLAVETREIGKSAGQPDAGLFFGGQRYHIRLEQGRLDELVDHMAGGLAHSQSALRRMLLALAYCELGRDDAARAEFEPLAGSLPHAPVDALWLELMAVGSMVCAHLRILPLAGRLADLLAPYAGQIVGGGSSWVRTVDYCVGLLHSTMGHFDEAERHFAAAAATEERIGAPAWLARTRLEWAWMLVVRDAPGDLRRATDLLNLALATARGLGIATVERRAAALLRP